MNPLLHLEASYMNYPAQFLMTNHLASARFPGLVLLLCLVQALSSPADVRLPAAPFPTDD